jgi:hypothetical protein
MLLQAIGRREGVETQKCGSFCLCLLNATDALGCIKQAKGVAPETTFAPNGGSRHPFGLRKPAKVIKIRSWLALSKQRGNGWQGQKINSPADF